MNKDKARAGIYGMAALYLLYLAWQMFTARNNGDETKFMMMLVFAVIFAVVAVGFIVVAIGIAKKSSDAPEELPEEPEEKE